MNKFLKQNLLPISVFITGACVLVVEVIATRVLSPHYGNTIFTVSSVISVILAALSIGYYTGGKLADRRPSLRWFFWIILLSGLVILALHAIGTTLLPVLSTHLSLTSGPLISSLFLFFTPALLLGTLSPYAIKLQSIQAPELGIGMISGNIFFWSTLGSIVGSLLTGFVLIPHFGIDRILISTGITLFFLGAIPLVTLGLKGKRLAHTAFVAIALTSTTLLATQQAKGNVIYNEDGVYEKIAIEDGVYENRPTRFFYQDRSSSGAMYLDSNDPTDLVYAYTKYYALYKIFTPNIQNALVIGGGAYSIPKAILAEQPNAIVDVSEIEPGLFELAKTYFNVAENASNLHNKKEDGRRLLRDSEKKYDLIFSDVYYSLFSIPAHFTTQEFFTTAKEKLAKNGVFIASIIGDLSRKQPSLAFAEIKTFQSVFPNSYFFAVKTAATTDSQNIILVGYNSETKIDVNDALIAEHQNPTIRSLREKAIDLDRFDLSPYPILTDNFSPVEYLTAKMLQRATKTASLADGEEMLSTIDQQLRYGPRHMDAPGMKKMRAFLIAEMKARTDEIVVQSWDHAGKDGNVSKLANVIGRLNPLEKRRIIIATHYDTKKIADKDPEAKGQPVPGANDGASGVAVLMELARAIKESNIAPNLGIDFVFFDGEEGDGSQGSDYTDWKPLGSTYFAEHLADVYGDEKPMSAIVLDMVCDKDLKIYQEKSSVQDAKTYVETFWDTAKTINPHVFREQIASEIRDDHTSLNQAGIPSFLLIDYEYPPYHTTHDTRDKCSARSLETVTRAVLKYVALIHEFHQR